MNKYNKYDEDYFDEDVFDEGANGSRYRLKKRGRRKNTYIVIFIFLCIITGSAVVYSFFNGDSSQTGEEVQKQKNEAMELDITGDEVDHSINEDDLTMDHLSLESLNNNVKADNVIEDNDRAINADEKKVETPEQKEIATKLAGDNSGEDKIIEHKVQPGDSLYKLSIKYYKSPQYQQFLAGFNNLKNGNDLQVGQSIRIPFPPVNEWHDDEEVSSIVVATNTSSTGLPVHIVEAGDTLYSISVKYYNTAKYQDLIAEHNRLANPEALTVGEKLEIPAISENN